MGDQLTTSAAALRMFFTDDIYLVNDEGQVAVGTLPEVNSAAAIETAAAGNTIAATADTLTVEAELPIVAAIPVVKPTGTNETIAAANTLPIEAELPIIAIPVVKPAAVIETAELNEAPIAPATGFTYLGKNQKNVLILVKDDQNDVSTERGRELLRNIVKALQLTANDFALLNYHAYAGQQLPALSAFFSSKLVLAFGVGPQQLGLTAHPANSLVMEGKIQLVFSQNLDLLADNQAEKKALWGSLKKIQL